LTALGLKLQQLDLFGPIRTTVQVPQKRVRYAPQDKLYAAFISLLCGAHGLVELNGCLRPDAALQAAFGCSGCAEQSVVQDTLDAATPTTVAQLEAALATIYQQHSRGYRHDYAAQYQLLDADMSGLPCGPKAACATKGYFAKQRNRRGRQLGRVTASHYGEVVVDRVFAGTTQLSTALRPLMEAAETTLKLTPEQRARTIIRVDAGGGSLDDVNWLLARGYQYHGKDYSSVRAAHLAASVREWWPDPKIAGREVGWVQEEPTAYVCPVVRVAVRCRKKNGQWGYGVLVSSLGSGEIQDLRGTPRPAGPDQEAALLAYVYFYDERGGGVETTLKEDKQGLAVTKRAKKRWEAQQVLVYLSTLAHNVLIWAREWLAPQAPGLRRYGIKRWVRDVWRIYGLVEVDQHGQVQRIILNQAHRLAQQVVAALQALVGSEHAVVSLGET
jgi:hypothetical protein